MHDDTDSPSGNSRSRMNRVARACDRCRIRKIKCNGKSQCNRCTTDDAICIYTKKRRPNDRIYSKEYVQLLEEQRTALVKGVRELYRRCNAGESLPGLHECGDDNVLIHDLLEALNVLPKQHDGTIETDDGSVEGEETAISSAASDCHANSVSAALSDTQLPALCKSPTCSASEIASSPAMPWEADFDGIMNSLDDGQLPTLETMSASKIGSFPCDYVSPPYLATYQMSNTMTGQYFINPQDMNFVAPFLLSRSYAV